MQNQPIRESLININEIIQNTTLPNWYRDKINDETFFYLLRWDKPKKIYKFGYKLSIGSFKSSYANFNHLRPTGSNIWSFELPKFDSKLNYYIERGYLGNFF